MARNLPGREKQPTAYIFILIALPLQLKTEDYVNAIGPEKSKEVYLWVEPGQYERFPEGKQDNTYLTLFGAIEYARLAVKGIIELGLPPANLLKEQ